MNPKDAAEFMRLFGEFARMVKNQAGALRAQLEANRLEQRAANLIAMNDTTFSNEGFQEIMHVMDEAKSTARDAYDRSDT